jgi:hypothetical protein
MSKRKGTTGYCKTSYKAAELHEREELEEDERAGRFGEGNDNPIALRNGRESDNEFRFERASSKFGVARAGKVGGRGSLVYSLSIYLS